MPLAAVWPLRPGTLSITMAPDQWDALLAAAYAAGCSLPLLLLVGTIHAYTAAFVAADVPANIAACTASNSTAYNTCLPYTAAYRACNAAVC